MQSLLTVSESALYLIQTKTPLKATTGANTYMAQLCCFGDIRLHILLVERNDIASA